MSNEGGNASRDEERAPPHRRYPRPHATHRRQDTVPLLLLIFAAGLSIIIIIRESSINTNTIWDNKTPINSEGSYPPFPSPPLPPPYPVTLDHLVSTCTVKATTLKRPFSYPLDCLPYPPPLSTNTCPVSNIRCPIKRLNHLNFHIFFATSANHNQRARQAQIRGVPGSRRCHKSGCRRPSSAISSSNELESTTLGTRSPIAVP